MAGPLEDYYAAKARRQGTAQVPPFQSSDVRVRGAETDIQRDQAAMEAERERIRLERERLEADRIKAAPEIAKDEKDLAEFQRKRESTIAQYNERVRRVQEALNEAREIVRKNRLGTTGWGSFLEYLPATDARRLSGLINDMVAANSGFDELQQMRQSSETGAALGPVSDLENTLLQSVKATMDLGQTGEQVLRSFDQAEEAFLRGKPIIAGEDPNDPEIARKYGYDKFFRKDDPLAPKIASGDTKSVEPPQEMQREYMRQLMQIGRGNLTPEAYVDLRNKLDQQFGFEAAHKVTPEVEELVKQFNLKGAEFKYTIPGAKERATSLEQDISKAAQHPIGTGVFTGANALGGGIMELLGGPDARRAYSAMRDINPYSALLGDVLGSMTAVGGVGRGAKAAGLLVDRPIARDMLTDMSYSALREFNSAEEGEGLLSAVGGAGEAGAFNLGLRGLTRGARDLTGAGEYQSFFKDKPNEFQATVNEYPELAKALTTSQKLGLGTGEASVGRFMGVKGPRAKASETASRQFIGGVYSSLGQEIPRDIKTGRALIDDAHTKVDSEYDSIKAETLGKVGNNTVSTLAELFKIGNYIDPYERRVAKKILDILKPLRVNGKFNASKELSGAEYREIMKGLNRQWKKLMKENRSELGDSPYEMAQVISTVKSALTDSIDDVDIKNRMGRANEAYSRLVLFEDAAGAGTSGVPTPEQLLRSAERHSKAASLSAFPRGQAPYQKELEDYVSLLGKSEPQDAPTAYTTNIFGTSVGTGKAAMNLPGIAQALAMRRPGFSDLPSELVVPTMSQALQSYITRKKQEEGLEYPSLFGGM